MLKNNFYLLALILAIILFVLVVGHLGFKWSIFLLGLFIIASLPIIFSFNKVPEDSLGDIKIIVEKD